MSRWTAYRQLGLVGALGALVWAACTPVGPATDIDPTPTPAPAVTPTPAATPSPAVTAAAATSTPLVIDYDYDYGDVPAASPSPAEPGSAIVDVALGVDDAYLVGPNGHALYVFSQDGAGVSNCRGTCADAWPPLTVGPEEVPTGGDGASGEVDVIEREDGTLQVTYDGAPLYYYTADQAPGDTAGEGVGGVWFLARP